MLRRRIVNKVMVNWVASFLSVVLLLSMAAAPVVASVTANSVGSPEIIDRSVKAVDIATGAIKKWKLADGAVTSKKIRNNGVFNRDIRPNVISSSRIKDNTILNRDIHANVISSSRIRNGTILNADIAAGAAIAESKIKYSTKTRHLSVPFSAFRPTNPIYTYETENEGSATNGAEIYLYCTSGGWGYFQAPVFLPDGATVTSVRYHGYDNHPVLNNNMSLVSRDSLSSAQTMMAKMLVPDQAAWQQIEDSSIAGPIIDNANNSYFLRANMYGPAGTNMRLGDVMITYVVAGP